MVEKVKTTKLERKVYEYYLLFIHKNSRLKWNSTMVPNKLKEMAKEIVKLVRDNTKK